MCYKLSTSLRRPALHSTAIHLATGALTALYLSPTLSATLRCASPPLTAIHSAAGTLTAIYLSRMRTPPFHRYQFYRSVACSPPLLDAHPPFLSRPFFVNHNHSALATSSISATSFASAITSAFAPVTSNHSPAPPSRMLGNRSVAYTPSRSTAV